MFLWRQEAGRCCGTLRWGGADAVEKFARCGCYLQVFLNPCKGHGVRCWIAAVFCLPRSPVLWWSGFRQCSTSYGSLASRGVLHAPPLVLGGGLCSGMCLVLGRATIGQLGSPGMVLRRALLSDADVRGDGADGVYPAGNRLCVRRWRYGVGVGTDRTLLRGEHGLRRPDGAGGTDGNGDRVSMSLSWIPLALAALFWGPAEARHSAPVGVALLPLSTSGITWAQRSLPDWAMALAAAAELSADAGTPRATASILHDGEERSINLGLIRTSSGGSTQEAAERFLLARSRSDAIADGRPFSIGEDRAWEQGPCGGRRWATFRRCWIRTSGTVARARCCGSWAGLRIGASSFQDAARELEVYVRERRPFDPEGLYYYGQAMEGLGKAAAARELFERAVDADRTALARYRRRYTARWEQAGAEGDIEEQAPRRGGGRSASS